jgi:hypothetical protein
MSKNTPPRKGSPGDQGRSKATTRVPACYIGKVANGERSAIPALHLLAYKLSRRDGFTLNINDVKKRLRMGGDRFKAALRHLRMEGVLSRRQVGRRSWAVETLVPSSANAFWVPIPDFVIENHRSEITAFTLAANVSPTPRKTSEIASKIGIRSNATSRAVLEECCALGTVEQYIDEKGAVRVCRPGERPIEGGCQKSAHQNPPHQKSSHTEDMKEGQSKGKNVRRDEDIFAPSGANVAVSREPEFLWLRNWWEAAALAPMIADTDFGHIFSTDEVFSAVSASAIESVLALHGQAAPTHFTSPTGVEQFRSLLTAVLFYEPDLTAGELLDGLCAALARHLELGKTIRSLALVAQPILRDSHGGDFSWATHFASHRLGGSLGDYVRWAEGKLLPALEAAGVPFEEDRLTATRAIERLADLYAEHGQRKIEQACRSATLAPSDRLIRWDQVLNGEALPSLRRSYG